MQLTRAADYAVRVMIYLAGQPEGTTVSKAVLARAAEAPESFLAKILQSLSRTGLVQTRRGVEGGFMLLPQGARASLLEVVEAIDGPIALNRCVASGAPCSRKYECPAHGVWVEAQSAMVAVLRKAKIRSMAAGQKSGSELLSIAEASTEERQDTISVTQQTPQPKPTTRVRRAASGRDERISAKNKI